MPIKLSTSEIDILKSDLENTRKAQQGSDRAVMDLKKKLTEAEKTIETLNGRISKESDLTARLSRIYSEFEKKDQARELKYFTRVQCLEKKIPYKLIENDVFVDQEAVLSRLATVEETLEQVRITGIESQLGTTKRPQTGVNTEPKAPTLQDLNKAFLSGGIL